MTRSMLVFLAIAFFLGSELYLAYHLRRLVGFNKIKSRKVKILVSFLIVAVIFLIAMIRFPFIFGVFIYISMLFVIFDILRLILKKLIKNTDVKDKISKAYMGGLWVVILGIVLTTVGYFNAKNFRVVEYDVSVNKEMDKELNVVFMTDMHMGTSIDDEALTKIVDKVNALDADMVILGGDIFDERTPEDLLYDSIEIMAGFRSTYGTYYVFGNHDDGYHGKENQRVKEITEAFQASGIKVLVDEAELIDDSFYVIGRSDSGTQSRGGLDTATVEELYKGLDKSLPIITVNHKPVDIQEEADNGADLFLAGHTHNGQLWPYNIAVKYFSSNELNKGQKEYGDLTAITSVGVGTWLIPVKTTGPSEICFIKITGR